MRPETYEQIRVNADYEKTNANIRRFIDLKQAGGYRDPFVNLQIIEMEKTVGEVDEFVAAWKLPGVDRINVKPFDSWAGQIDRHQRSATRRRTDAGQTLSRALTCGITPTSIGMAASPCATVTSTSRIDLGNVAQRQTGTSRCSTTGMGRRCRNCADLHVQNTLEHVSPCNTCVEWAWWKPAPFKSHGNYNAVKLEEHAQRRQRPRR